MSDDNKTVKNQTGKALSRITTDLKSAIDQWELLSAQAPTLSAEEQRFKDMQQLLKELREKMEELKFI